MDARELVKTDDNFGNAKVDFESTNKNIRRYFEEHKSSRLLQDSLHPLRKMKLAQLAEAVATLQLLYSALRFLVKKLKFGPMLME